MTTLTEIAEDERVSRNAGRYAGTFDAGCRKCGGSYALHCEDASGRPASRENDGWRTLPEADARRLRMTRCLYSA